MRFFAVSKRWAAKNTLSFFFDYSICWNALWGLDQKFHLPTETRWPESIHFKHHKAREKLGWKSEASSETDIQRLANRISKNIDFLK